MVLSVIKYGSACGVHHTPTLTAALFQDISYCMEPLLTLGRMIVELCNKGPDALPSIPVLQAGFRAAYEMVMPLLTPVMKVGCGACAKAHALWC